jgi:hypothetical protein
MFRVLLYFDFVAGGHWKGAALFALCIMKDIDAKTPQNKCLQTVLGQGRCTLTQNIW